MSKSLPPKSAAEIREAFHAFFEAQGHTRVASSSLIPANDPTLLFTNAGMVQFKDCFLGLDRREYQRAVSAQKCVRAGGKHNDLENVGFTARHHTFFEMLGNFSFGNYFKKEAIHFAWEFVTQVLKLPKERLRVSVFEKDDESAEIWMKQEKIPAEHIMRFGEKDNFWSMGDTGPCGPCTEIFWDQGKEVDGERYLEFWNCVFMQFDRDEKGVLHPLPAPSVDTGMGLERMAAIMQGVPSNYDIDLMRGLIDQTAALVSDRTKQKFVYQTGSVDPRATALKVIVDHLRSTSFLIADGVLPSNEGRGYVLRRILRRAVRFGQRLGLESPFLADLYPALVASMGSAYPELVARERVVTEILRQEEEKFWVTLSKGLELLETAFSQLGSQKTVPGDVLFKLYDTFGFPMDLSALIARERGLGVDESGFNKAMEEAKTRARSSWKGSGAAAVPPQVREWKSKGIQPRFVGYQDLAVKTEVTAAYVSDAQTFLSLKENSFYPEGGGQVGDRGSITDKKGNKFSVIDTLRPYDGGAVLVVDGAGALTVGAEVMATVDARLRSATRSNHTATHLLHAALREVLGTHVEQAGSLVDENRLRFDFSHPKSVSRDELSRIEGWVNAAIEADSAVGTETTTYDNAIKKGALALFGEKYGDQVRMVQVPGYSTELCGGTHVSRTSEIRFFKIVSESAVAAGTRRIEAVTATRAIELLSEKADLLGQLAAMMKVAPDALLPKLTKVQERERELEREIANLKKRLASGTATDAKFVETKVWGLAAKLHELAADDVAMLRDHADQIRSKEKQYVHVLMAGTSLLITADVNSLKTAHAGDILRAVVQQLGGKGGGQAQTAQGQLAQVIPLERVKECLEQLSLKK